MIGIVDYEGGNLASVACAVRHLGHEPLVTSEPEKLLAADKVIFPGVGAAGATMAALKKAGLIDLLKFDLPRRGTPCLGICIGIQILFEHSEEDNVDTLGILPGRVVRFPRDGSVKVPHIGWNTVRLARTDVPVLRGVADNDYYYFVNSYHVEPASADMVLGRTTYGGRDFASLIQHGNWHASQFHLEKSGRAGLKLLGNFLAL